MKWPTDVSYRLILSILLYFINGITSTEANLISSIQLTHANEFIYNSWKCVFGNSVRKKVTESGRKYDFVWIILYFFDFYVSE